MGGVAVVALALAIALAIAIALARGVVGDCPSDEWKEGREGRREERGLGAVR